MKEVRLRLTGRRSWPLPGVLPSSGSGETFIGFAEDQLRYLAEDQLSLSVESVGVSTRELRVETVGCERKLGSMLPGDVQGVMVWMDIGAGCVRGARAG